MKKKKRDSFDTKLGFILACIGSAVGMGNIWLFPYRVGQFGGLSFLIPYIIFVILIGITGVVGEIAFGRATRNGPLGAFRKALERRNKKFGELIGLIPVLGSFGIAIGYSVVVGYIIRFFVLSVLGGINTNFSSEIFFNSISSKYSSITWHLIAILLVFAIMSLGIKDGIEKLNKLLIPLFFVLFIFLMLRVLLLEDSFKGYKFLLSFDLKNLFSLKTMIFALGQAFFSLSLAGSGTLVYGSYLKDDVDVVKSSLNIALFDTLAAILSSLVIIPAVFAFSIKPSAGPALMFIVMPKIFKEIPFGSFFASIFFLAVLFAGITSLINLFEAPIEAIKEKFDISRVKAVLIICVIAFLTGVFLEDVSVLGKFMDFISINVIPLGALLSAVMFFYISGDEYCINAINLGRGKSFISTKFIVFSGKYIFCLLTLVVLILGVVLKGIA